MGTRTWIAALVVVGAVGWFGRGAFSEDEKKPEEGGGAPDMEKMMEELARPGAMHAMLAKFDGTWDVAGAFQEMDGSTTETKGTATIKMVLGGRWSQQTFSASMKGKPFDGIGFMGYDNGRKEFVNYWFDTMSTGTAPATGSCSADGKVLTLAGVWEVPGKKMTFKYVLTWLSDKQFRFDMLMGEGGQDMPVGELTYTRK